MSDDALPKMIDRDEAAALIHRYYMHEIGRLMQQAEHWRLNGAPLAVLHRVRMADSYFQVANLFDPRQRALGHDDPFQRMQRELEVLPVKEPGSYPPSIELHAFRDPRHVVRELDGPPAAS